MVIREAHNRVGGCDIEVVADKRHAEGRIQPLQEDRPSFHGSIAIGVAQQRDTVSTGNAGTYAFFDELHNPAFNAIATPRLRGSVRLGDQDVAVGKSIEPARMIEVSRVSAHRKTRSSCRRHTVGPAFCRGDVEGREKGRVWWR
jgi:hypothetical protein